MQARKTAAAQESARRPFSLVSRKKALTFHFASANIHLAHGGIAQLGERLNGIQEVSGSIPLISTINVGYDALEKVLNLKGFGTFFLLFAPI